MRKKKRENEEERDRVVWQIPVDTSAAFPLFGLIQNNESRKKKRNSKRKVMDRKKREKIDGQIDSVCFLFAFELKVVFC